MMKSVKLFLSISLLFTFHVAIPARAQVAPLDSLTNQLQTYLEIIHAKKHFSGEVLVAKGQRILFRKAMGSASIEHGVAMKTNAAYRIASITKSFTGTLIAMAEQEKKLSFSDRAIQYIPGLSDTFKDITIHQLLTHSSGLPHNEGIKDYWLTKSKLQMTNEQVINEINAVDLLFEPGNKTHYSTLGYYLLAVILETVYDDDYQTIAENKILKPLDMNETGTANTLAIIQKMARGYHLVTDDSLVVAPYRNYSMLKGAGDMISTASDLLKWSSSFFTNTLLKDETKAVLFTPDKTTRSEDKTNSYGWYVDTEKPKKYYRGGGTWGYSSYLVLYPEDEITIIILSNISFLPTEAIAGDIEKIVYGLPFKMPVLEEAVPESAVDLNLYTGNFLSDSNNMNLRIIQNESGLFAKLGGNPAFQIYPKGNHQFFGKKVDIQFSFDIKDGAVRSLTAEGMGRTFHFTKTD
jgi:CubicO group peptidase (beta-lactamase class C family)